MSKLIMIHTISKFRHGYAVRVDDDADPEKVFEEIVDNSEELYQTWCGERFETSYEITEEDVIKLFDLEHPYATEWTREKKLEYIKDYTKKEEH